MITQEYGKKNHGITLISLVITIILLLILAGVAITLAVDSNGLFARAGEAANKWNTSVATEEEAIGNLLTLMNQIAGDTTTGGDDQDDDDKDPDPIVLPDGWDPEKVGNVVTEGENKAPIPNGYVASDIEGETSIEGGLVIYEETETSTNPVSTDEDAKTTRNQYVWIPVNDINSMVMCQEHGAAVQLNQTTLQCPTCGTETRLAGKLYATAEGANFNPDLEGQTYSGANLFEPNTVLLETERWATYKEFFDFTGTVEDFKAQLQSDFDKMAKSVALYKGFFISRYEVNVDGNSMQDKPVAHAGTDSKNTWYGLYDFLRTDSSNLNTSMIFGCQYDQVMKFIDSKERLDGEGYEFDISTAYWERHKAAGAENTGKNLHDLVCNIYDLEGNYFEWTIETGDTAARIQRGGYYNGAWSASYRRRQEPGVNSEDFVSSRKVMYIPVDM